MLFSIIGGFLFGYDMGVIAGALLELEKDFNLDVMKKELVVSVTVVTAALGALCGGPSNEKIPTYLLSDKCMHLVARLYSTSVRNHTNVVFIPACMY